MKKIAETNEFDIRFTELADLKYLRKWFENKELMHWFPPSTENELENFFRIWLGFSQYKASLTALYRNIPVGMAVLYLMPYRKVAHQCMFQIVVDPQKQREGIGRSLMRNLMHLAQNRFHLELIHAEILDENPLIFLLQSLGFKEYGRQENYVKENGKYFPRILMEYEYR